ncbi:choice-of-anchor Q domain-containing protein [Pontibacter harenae]|uniref:choice-of-anchor Q domain-containing protein n=1 Tax=Pontibacter harenae TaxID=2894083 RepID=UPI001E5782C8|nr:choice-of-anchor Q domain-containing protein [Pontibacter harenae]MCC9165437.1 hypothetical protein [Pontibacter harenae]
MKYLLLILPLLLLLSLLGCEPNDEVLTTDASAVLEFSTDTVLFDTVFVQQGSVTKRLKVYNSNRKAVKINSISLAGAASSPYQLTVNGVEGPVVSNLELRGQDSLYILVKVQINPSDEDLPFLVADSIIFNTNGQQQDVKLVAYGQNAVFYRKSSLGTTTWTNDKPYVLLDTVQVQPGATLTIQKGARIYAANKAVLLVNGNITVEGTPDERVSFSGYRHEPEYATAPGQWHGIRLLGQNGNNSIKYTDISNARTALYINNTGQSRNLVEGCFIKYAFDGGIMASDADVRLVNTLIYNCGGYSFGGRGGGNYEVLYSTIVNYNNRALRSSAAFVVTGYLQSEGAEGKPTNLRLLNSIVYSESVRDEIMIEIGEGLVEVENNLLRTERYKDRFSANGNVLNTSPMFKAPGKLDFSLDTLSPASNAAKPLPTVTIDFKGKTRSTTKPDMGAFERTID